MRRHWPGFLIQIRAELLSSFKRVNIDLDVVVVVVIVVSVVHVDVRFQSQIFDSRFWVKVNFFLLFSFKRKASFFLLSFLSQLGQYLRWFFFSLSFPFFFIFNYFSRVSQRNSFSWCCIRCCCCCCYTEEDKKAIFVWKKRWVAWQWWAWGCLMKGSLGKREYFQILVIGWRNYFLVLERRYHNGDVMKKRLISNLYCYQLWNTFS